MIADLEKYAEAVDDSFARRARWTELLRAEPEGEESAMDMEEVFSEN